MTTIEQQRPQATSGLRHVALFVPDLERACHFYIDLLGMQIEWQPDADNIYLTSGNDNLALHREEGFHVASSGQRLDHIGFILDSAALVDEWHDFLAQQGVAIKAAPRTHRDGARSFYCLDPAGTVVQLIYHPPLAGQAPAAQD
ncbi:MAG: VOC family protein [Gammaproteobacteria bacterium]|nr:VOC family protein [Gammaproteobacteria bacterium]